MTLLFSKFFTNFDLSISSPVSRVRENVRELQLLAFFSFIAMLGSSKNGGGLPQASNGGCCDGDNGT
jgi:hypothetical protein